MPSTITNYSALIDLAFPVSGRDNDTAGFRNNFVNIKNSLDTAADEISTMQVTQAGFAAQLATIPLVAGVDWPNITNKPNFATVSTSGSFTDLSNVPEFVTTTSYWWQQLESTTGGSQPQVSDIPNDSLYDSIEALATPVTDNIIQINTATLISHYKVGQNIRIFGASTTTNLLSTNGIISSVSLNGFAGIPGTSTLEYNIAQIDLDTGEISPVTENPRSISVDLNEFNLINNVSVNISRTSTKYGVLLYRKSPGSIDFQLIAVLGSKEFLGNLSISYIDYYNFDYNFWSNKSSTTNAFLPTSGVVHVPTVAPNTAIKGWNDATITAVNTTTGRITISKNLSMNQTVLVSHDDTALIQSSINNSVTKGTNFLRLGSKQYIISNIAVPSGFTLYGNNRRASLKRLAWASNDQTTNKMLTSIEDIAESISVNNLEFNGNMQNQFLVSDDLDPYTNYCIDIRGSNHVFDNLIVTNVVGGGISSTEPASVRITNCLIEGGGLSDRYELAPVISDNGTDLIVSNNIMKNFPGSVDISLTNRGVVNGNIVSNCGSGILIYGSINLSSSQNVILGPAGEFIPGPDLYNSEYDAVNIVLEPDNDFLSDLYVYQENGELFNLTNNNGSVNYKVEKLRKIDNVEELYGEITVQDPSTSTVKLISPLFPILNTDFSNGEFRFLITRDNVNSLTNFYSYSNLKAIEPNHVGLTYKAMLTEYSPIGQVTSATLFTTGGSPSYIEAKVPNAQNIAIGSTVRFQNLSTSPSVSGLDGIITNADTANQLYTVKYDAVLTAVDPVNPLTQLSRQNTFILAKGRIQ